MRNTKTIKLTNEAWTACVRFWILRAAIIIVGGIVVGYFLNQALSSTSSPTNNNIIQTK